MAATVGSASQARCIPSSGDRLLNGEAVQGNEHRQCKQDYVAVLSGNKHRTYQKKYFFTQHINAL